MALLFHVGIVGIVISYFPMTDSWRKGEGRGSVCNECLSDYEGS